MGNLGVQRIIEGVVKLRTAFGPGSGKPQHPDVQAYMDSHGGKDPFGKWGRDCWSADGIGGLPWLDPILRHVLLVVLCQPDCTAFKLYVCFLSHVAFRLTVDAASIAR
jgi:hypothetical protein